MPPKAPPSLSYDTDDDDDDDDDDLPLTKCNKSKPKKMKITESDGDLPTDGTAPDTTTTTTDAFRSMLREALLASGYSADSGTFNVVYTKWLVKMEEEDRVKMAKRFSGPLKDALGKSGSLHEIKVVLRIAFPGLAF